MNPTPARSEAAHSGVASHSTWRARLKAALWHLGVSAIVVLVCAGLVLLLWYPEPFRQISGGRDLFYLVAAVDLVVGPLLTFVVFDRRKPRTELTRDLLVIAALQIGALVYGLHSVALARPVVVALEGDRLRVVRAIDVDAENLARAPEGLRMLSWTGPLWLATRAPAADEQQEALARGLAGEDIGMRPEFWLPLAQTAPALARAAKPLRQLIQRMPQARGEIERVAARTGRSLDQLGYLPLLARSTDWSALVDLKDGSVVDYVAVDGF